MAFKAIDNFRDVVETNPDLLTRADLKPLRQRLLDAPLGFYRLFKQALVREMGERVAVGGARRQVDARQLHPGLAQRRVRDAGRGDEVLRGGR